MSTTGTLVQVGGVPECNDTWNAFAAAFIAAVQVQIPTATSYVLSESTPSVDDQDKAWVKLSGGYLEGVYAFNNGIWARPHPIAASSQERKIFVGVAGNIPTYDGGEAGTATATTGPFWEIDTDFAARMPLGVGELPVAGVTVAVGDTGGADKITLDEGELPEHTHTFSLDQFSNHDSSTSNPTQLLASNLTVENAGGVKPDVTNSSVGNGESHQNMPPYVGVYFIKRTSRIYIRG